MDHSPKSNRTARYPGPMKLKILKRCMVSSYYHHTFLAQTKGDAVIFFKWKPIKLTSQWLHYPMVYWIWWSFLPLVWPSDIWNFLNRYPGAQAYQSYQAPTSSYQSAGYQAPTQGAAPAYGAAPGYQTTATYPGYQADTAATSYPAATAAPTTQYQAYGQQPQSGGYSQSSGTSSYQQPPAYPQSGGYQQPSSQGGYDNSQGGGGGSYQGGGYQADGGRGGGGGGYGQHSSSYGQSSGSGYGGGGRG